MCQRAVVARRVDFEATETVHVVRHGDHQVNVQLIGRVQVLSTAARSDKTHTQR